MDTGQDITVPDSMTIAEAEALVKDTQNRFFFELTDNPTLISCTWRNYYKKAGKRQKDSDGAYKLCDIQTKLVVIK